MLGTLEVQLVRVWDHRIEVGRGAAGIQTERYLGGAGSGARRRQGNIGLAALENQSGREGGTGGASWEFEFNTGIKFLEGSISGSSSGLNQRRRKSPHCAHLQSLRFHGAPLLRAFWPPFASFLYI